MPILGGTFIFLSYLTWVSDIEATTMVSKKLGFYYALTKFFLPIYSIWAFYVTLKAIRMSSAVLKKKTDSRMSSSDTIKELQNALDTHFNFK